MTEPMTPENQIPATMVDQIEITLAVGGLTPVQKATLEASKNHLVRQAKRIEELEAALVAMASSPYPLHDHCTPSQWKLACNLYQTALEARDE